jgi:hypothetical protein
VYQQKAFAAKGPWQRFASTMALALDRKACTTCATSKRKCSRQLPACERCQARGLDCNYPPSQPNCWVLCVPEDDIGSASISLRSSQVTPGNTLESARSFTDILTSPDTILPIQSPLPVGFCELRSAWFLAPDTWNIEPVARDEVGFVICNDVLKRYVRRLQSLASDWVINGSSPLFHARLYKYRFPRCMQDAYTTLSSYLVKCPNSNETILRIVADRGQQLIQDQVSTGSSSKLDTFDHIARTHALLIFTIISLFDGDIHLRHLAEKQLPTLAQWNRQMLDSARSAASNGELLLCDLTNGNKLLDMELIQSNQVEALWHAWILAESVRRTWLVASGVPAAYAMLQRGRVECNGGLMFTTLQGVWDASSAWAWTKLCAEQDVGFMPRGQTQRLFGDKTPDEVDHFGKLMLEVTYGLERMERWGVEIDG